MSHSYPSSLKLFHLGGKQLGTGRKTVVQGMVRDAQDGHQIEMGIQCEICDTNRNVLSASKLADGGGTQLSKPLLFHEKHPSVYNTYDNFLVFVGWLVGRSVCPQPDLPKSRFAFARFCGVSHVPALMGFSAFSALLLDAKNRRLVGHQGSQDEPKDKI